MHQHTVTTTTMALGDCTCKVSYYPREAKLTCSDLSESSVLAMLLKFKDIPPGDVSLLKEALGLERDWLVGFRDLRDRSDFCDKQLDAVYDALTKLVSVGHQMPSFPYPDGTRSSSSYKYVIYGADKKTRRGFIVYTSPSASFYARGKAVAEGVWVVLV